MLRLVPNSVGDRLLLAAAMALVALLPTSNALHAMPQHQTDNQTDDMVESGAAASTDVMDESLYLPLLPFQATSDEASSASVDSADGVAVYITKYYTLNGQRIAMWTNRPGYGQFRYLHQDHIGSTIAETGIPTGGVAHTHGYYAYGGDRDVDPSDGRLDNAATDYRFTGQMEDSKTGLYYYNARYYDPQIGHFISPDSIVPDPMQVMDYQRYAYVRGNPINASDPTGHLTEEELAAWFGEDWRNLLSLYWQSILLDQPGNEIKAAQLGDLMLIGESSDSLTQQMLVLGPDSQLAMWDVDNRTYSNFRSVMSGRTPSIVQLYRYRGGETGQDRAGIFPNTPVYSPGFIRRLAGALGIEMAKAPLDGSMSVTGSIGAVNNAARSRPIYQVYPRNPVMEGYAGGGGMSRVH